jgi:hypothetical protein
MGTGITNVIGGPHDFLPPRSDRSDEFQKLYYISRSYCKYRNKFGKLGIRNRIEYVIFYLFLLNIIGNCHENKYIWIYCDA